MEVIFFSVLLCQRCRKIWREILVKFSALRFPGFGCATENFTKISRRKQCEKRKISLKFHSAARRSAEKSGSSNRKIRENQRPVLKLWACQGSPKLFSLRQALRRSPRILCCTRAVPGEQSDEILKNWGSEKIRERGNRALVIVF